MKTAMDIALLDEYIEFSKSLNISTAARHLFISQSTLSKHLKTLEDEVGVRLIDRNMGLKLTEAGQVFLDACSVISHTYDSALETCHTISRSPERLSILKPCTIDASNELVFTLFRHMQRDYPNISVKLLQMGGYSMMENLLLKRADCTTAHSNSLALVESLRKQGVELSPVFEDSIYIWIPVGHPLLEKREIFLEDLIDVPILVPASRVYMDLHEWIISLCAQRGFKPLLAYKDVADMYELMNSNIRDGVMILTSEATMGDPVIEMQQSMVLRPLADNGIKNTVYLAYLASNENPALASLLECLRNNEYPLFDGKGLTDVRNS